MKFTIKLMSVILLFTSFYSCEEDALVSDFNGKQPIPIIEEGTTEASQLAYSIYKKHDLHIYYDLEGEEALETEYGTISHSTPIKADEERAVIFLTLIDKMYDLFSDYREMQIYRRQLLVGNDFESTTASVFDALGFNRDFAVYNRQATQILSNVTNEFEFNLALTKEMLLNTYFVGYFAYQFSIPADFVEVSSGRYNDEVSFPLLSTSNSSYFENLATDFGFVHPYGTLSSSFNPYQDWESFVVWIISRPKYERDAWLDTKPLVKAKYDIVMATMLEEFEMDLEAFSAEWQLVGL